MFGLAQNQLIAHYPLYGRLIFSGIPIFSGISGYFLGGVLLNRLEGNKFLIPGIASIEIRSKEEPHSDYVEIYKN